MELRFYADDRGRVPVDIFVDGLSPTMQRRVVRGIERMEDGNLGDHKSLGGGLWERRFDFGSGYRIYFAKIEDETLILLGAGDKSRQARDIDKARERLKDYEQRAGSRQHFADRGVEAPF